MKLAVISDTHAIDDRQAAVGRRRGGWADILLLRAVHRLNRWVRPDAVVILGDLVNDGAGPGADAAYAGLRAALDRLTMPWLVLPGNHDADPERFFRHLPAPPPMVEVSGVRLLTFLDAEEPGYNSRRSEADLARIRGARADGWRGPVVSLQHVPVFPPGTHACPYNAVNAPAVLEAMAGSGVTASLAGHYHAGFTLTAPGGCLCATAPALCEAPFGFLTVELQGTDVRVERHTLAMPAEYGLVDAHLHTHLAYCNENMDAALAAALAAGFGLRDLRVTEHSGHLYFSAAEYGSVCRRSGIEAARPEADRMAAYRAALTAAGIPAGAWGIEIDCDARGNPVLRSEDSPHFPFRLGAMHWLPCLDDPGCTDERAGQEFLGMVERFLRHGFTALAHPFRVFRRARRPVPAGIIEPTVRLLRAAETAAEINFHTNEPPLELVQACLRHGVPMTFGSDAHNLYEVGEFAPHLDLLRAAGIDGDPGGALLSIA